jgi:hypothetical protein
MQQLQKHHLMLLVNFVKNKFPFLYIKMPSLKELRSQLKKSMKPISKMSRDEVVLMLEKHKVEMPKESTKKAVEKELKKMEKPAEKSTKKAVEEELTKPVKKEVKKEAVKMPESSEDEMPKEKVKKPAKKEAVKLPESSEDEMPKEKVKKVMKKVEPKEKVMKKKVTDQEDKSSSSETKDLTARQRWGQLRKEGLSSAEAWAKVRS